MRILLITSEWPTDEHPEWGTFVAQQVRFLRQAGLTIDVFPFRGRGSPLNYLSGWRAVRSRLKAMCYDLVHAHFGNSALLALPKTRPLVVTLHGSDVKGIVGAGGRYTVKGWLLNQISQWAARRADQVILVAEHLRQGLPERDYHVIPCGIDPERFKPIEQKAARAALGLLPDSPIIFFAADPALPVKRFCLAEQAVEIARLDHSDVVLLSAGRIRFEEMPLYFNAADALLLTSVHEGSPTVVKEALACNLPVVSVDVGDVREQLDGIEGNALCADQPEALAEGLLRVLRTRTRLDSHTRIVEVLSEESLVQQVVEVYRLAAGQET